MKLIKNHLLILIIVVVLSLIGSKAWSQKQEQLKTVPITEQALALAKGKLDRADSLRVLAEGIVIQQTEKINIYEVKITNLNSEIDLLKKNCELKYLNTNKKNLNLEEENKELKKSRNFWRTLAVGIPTVLSAAATYIILK